MEGFADWFSNDFMPHGHCYYWYPEILWTHLIADSLIALAYFSIPVTLAIFLRKRQLAEHAVVVWLFVLFITLCGITHLMNIVVIWNPVYPIQGVIKLATAIASVLTAVVIIKLLPKVMTLRTAKELQTVNDELQMSHTALEETNLQLEMSNRQLSEFSRVAAHDLREPVRKISIFGERLLESNPDLDEASKMYVDRMVNASHRMRHLVDSLMQLTQVGLADIVMTRVSLSNIVDRAVDNLQILIEENNATVKVSPLPEIKGDESFLEQMFQNFIQNAIRYKQPGRDPIVRIGACLSSDEQSMVIEIQDNGKGFEMEHATRIFEPFRRLESDATVGTGMGLAICRKIANLHNARVTVDSSPNQGTTFKIHFPVRQVDAPYEPIE